MCPEVTKGNVYSRTNSESWYRKGIECYVDNSFAGGWNQEVMSYIITYANCPIIWVMRLQIEIVLSTTEVEYIDLYQAIRDVLTFVSLMKEIEFILKLQGDTPTVLWSIFEKPVTFQEDNQGKIALAVAPQMQPCMKHTPIKYYHLQSFVRNGDIYIQHIETKEQIMDIFMKPLYFEFFGYLCYKLNDW